MASFPSSVKTFATLVDLADSVLAAHQNDRGGEITAIETELGVDPAGSYSTVVDRLNAMTALTYNNSTITTANLTCAENNVYNCTIAGLTANRNAVLPAPSAAGKKITINILDGDASYVLIVIGDTGVTINGGSAATEWSRLFIAGESVTLESTSTTNWQVTIDGRKPCLGIAERQAAQSINDVTNTKIALDAEVYDRGDIVDVATNDRINIRRAGIYDVSGYLGLTFALDDQERSAVFLYIDGVENIRNQSWVSSASANQYATTQVRKIYSLTAGQYIELYAYHNEGGAINTDTIYPPSLTVVEIL
jgi:hypothetical protein